MPSGTSYFIYVFALINQISPQTERHVTPFFSHSNRRDIKQLDSCMSSFDLQAKAVGALTFGVRVLVVPPHTLNGVIQAFVSSSRSPRNIRLVHCTKNANVMQQNPNWLEY